MTADSHSPAEPTVEFYVDAGQTSKRLDQLVMAGCKVSRRVARIWIGAERVSVKGKVTKIVAKTYTEGTQISVVPLAIGPVLSNDASTDRHNRVGNNRSPAVVEREFLPIEIIHCERHFAIINKPSGLLSNMRDQHRRTSVEQILPPLLSEHSSAQKMWLVHRLDAHTSGVMVVARSKTAVGNLGNQFRDGTVKKRYLALCKGQFLSPVEHNAPILRIGPGAKHGVAKGGKAAVTEFIPQQQGDWATFIEARPRTGRTHQIRVHLADLGFPILGDPLYFGARYTQGNSPLPILRCMLHAHTLEFDHPVSGERVHFTAPMADDFEQLADDLKLL